MSKLIANHKTKRRPARFRWPSLWPRLCLISLLSWSLLSWSSSPPEPCTDLVEFKPRHNSDSSATSALAPSPAKPEMPLATGLLTPRFLASLGMLPIAEASDQPPFTLDKVEPGLASSYTGRRNHSLSIDTTTSGTEAYASDSELEGTETKHDASIAIIRYHTTEHHPYVTHDPRTDAHALTNHLATMTTADPQTTSLGEVDAVDDTRYYDARNPFVRENLSLAHAWVIPNLTAPPPQPSRRHRLSPPATPDRRTRWRPTLPDILEPPSAANPYSSHSASPPFAPITQTSPAAGARAEITPSPSPLTLFLANADDPSYAAAGYRRLASPRRPATPRELAAHRLACSTVHTALYHYHARRTPTPRSDHRAITEAIPVHNAAAAPHSSRVPPIAASNIIAPLAVPLHQPARPPRSNSAALTSPVTVPAVTIFPPLPADLYALLHSPSLLLTPSPTDQLGIGSGFDLDDSNRAALRPYFDPAKETLYERRQRENASRYAAITMGGAGDSAAPKPQKLSYLTDLGVYPGPPDGTWQRYYPTTSDIPQTHPRSVSFRALH